VAECLSFDLSVRYADFTLEAAAEVPATGITALSGPSGSGKTTLLRALAGLEPRARGSVSFAGQDWTGHAPAARGIGYVFQDARLFPHLSVARNLAYGAQRRGIGSAQVNAVIRALDLAPLLNRTPATLSGGEARRVALGRALASGPQVLLMDEPLTGLDRARKADLMPYIARAVAGFGVPALYVTHSANEIAFLADRVLWISEGRIAGWGAASPRLTGRVVAADSGHVELMIGTQRVRIRGHGQIDETWAVPLGQAYLLSSAAPGASNAALVLQGQVGGFDPETGLCDLEIAGQVLAVPLQGLDMRALGPGAPIWLSLPSLAGHLVKPEAASAVRTV